MEGIQYQNPNKKKKKKNFTSNWTTGSLFSRTCAPASMHHRSHCSWRHTAKGWDPCTCSTPRGNGSKESWGSKGGGCGGAMWRYVALRYMVLLGSVQRESCVKPQIFKLERWLKYLQGSQIGDSKQILSHEREGWTKTLRNSEKQMCHSVPWPTLVHGRFHKVNPVGCPALHSPVCCFDQVWSIELLQVLQPGASSCLELEIGGNATKMCEIIWGTHAIS